MSTTHHPWHGVSLSAGIFTGIVVLVLGWAATLAIRAVFGSGDAEPAPSDTTTAAPSTMSEVVGFSGGCERYRVTARRPRAAANREPNTRGTASDTTRRRSRFGQRRHGAARIHSGRAREERQPRSWRAGAWPPAGRRIRSSRRRCRRHGCEGSAAQWTWRCQPASRRFGQCRHPRTAGRLAAPARPSWGWQFNCTTDGSAGAGFARGWSARRAGQRMPQAGGGASFASGSPCSADVGAGRALSAPSHDDGHTAIPTSGGSSQKPTSTSIKNDVPRALHRIFGTLKDHWAGDRYGRFVKGKKDSSLRSWPLTLSKQDRVDPCLRVA